VRDATAQYSPEKMRKKKETKNVKLGANVALLIIDVITDFEFEDGDKLFPHATEMAPRLAALKKKVKANNLPVIYINDNFGKWQEDFKSMLKACLKPSAKGRKFVQLLKPDADDYYILKPQRSAFYLSALESLLENLKVKKLILTGLTTDICILFSANDAHMRNYQLIIPQDCVCAITPEIHDGAVKFIERTLKADMTPSDQLRF
jgi:nicotinamidase-related amidase